VDFVFEEGVESLNWNSFKKKKKPMVPSQPSNIEWKKDKIMKREWDEFNGEMKILKQIDRILIERIDSRLKSLMFFTKYNNLSGAIKWLLERS
jgi:hypothetical protein